MNWYAQISKQYIFRAMFGGIWRGNLMILHNIQTLDGIPFRDHINIPYTRRYRRQQLNRGDTIFLRGKVNRYYKKPPGEKYKVRNPKTLIPNLAITNIHIIKIERLNP